MSSTATACMYVHCIRLHSNARQAKGDGMEDVAIFLIIRHCSFVMSNQFHYTYNALQIAKA